MENPQQFFLRGVYNERYTIVRGAESQIDKEVLDSSAVLYSDRTAFLYKPKGSDKYEPITYSKFKNDVDALGTALIDIGLKTAEWQLSAKTGMNGRFHTWPW